MSILLFTLAAVTIILSVLSTGVLACVLIYRITDKKEIDYSAVPILGIVFYSLYVFTIGLFAGLNLFLLCLPVVLAIPLYKHLKNLVGDLFGEIKSLTEVKWAWFYLTLGLIISVFTFLRLFGVRIFGDALTYHLFIPKYYVSAGHILRVPFSEHALWPQLVGMFSTVALKFGSIPAAKFFSFLVFLGIALFTYLITRLLTKNKMLSLISSSIVMATPAYFLHASGTYVDLAAAFFSVGMIYFLLKHYEEGGKVYLVIAAVSCAGALSCKFTSIIALSSALVIILFASRRWNKLSDFLLFFLLAIGVSSPWYLWSFIESGNPVFPYAANIFGSGFTSAVTSGEMTVLGRLVEAGTGSSVGVARNAVNFILLPATLTFKSAYFGGEKIGLIFILFLPLFIFSFFIKKKTWILHAFIILYMVQWFNLSQFLRYIYPVLPVYICTSLLCAEKVWEGRIFKGLFFVILVPVLILQASWSGYYLYQDHEYLFKEGEREDYLDSSYGAGKFLEENGITGERILLVKDSRVFYLPEGTIRERTFRNFTGYHREKDKADLLREHDIEYVLVKTSGESMEGYDPASYFTRRTGREYKFIDKYAGEDEYVLLKVKNK